MPRLLEFNTQDVRPWDKPRPDTATTLVFTPPFCAPPRVPHGFRQLDLANNANIRAESTLVNVTKAQADCHVTSWSDTTLYSAIVDVLALAPHETEFECGEHMRNLLANPNDPASVRIPFRNPFHAAPKVAVFLNFLDLDKNYNWRIKTTATDIDARGFTLNIETWSDTKLYAAKVCWIAYPADCEDIFSTTVNTMDSRPWDKPQLRTNKKIFFDAHVEFEAPPTVFIALNSIDISCKANLRINAYADSVTTTGLVWNIDAWFNTILYSAGATIIAFDPECD